MAESSESSTYLTSTGLEQDVATVSPEDIAWADSCLCTDPDMLDSGWNSLKEALLETLDSRNQPSSFEKGNSSEESIMEIISSETTSIIRNSEEKTRTQHHSSPYDRDRSPFVLQSPAEKIHPSDDINDLHYFDITPVSIASTREEPEQNCGDRLNHEDAEDLWSKHKTEDVFLPTYNENSRVLEASNPEVEFVFQEFQSPEDIFRIWDFEIPPEEHDLMKQLDKALAENTSEPTLPFIDDYEALKGWQGDTLDDLISGIADLALSPKLD